MLTAPVLDDYIRGIHPNTWNAEKYTPETVKSIHKIFDAIEKIAPIVKMDYTGNPDPDKRYEFWIKLKTGTLDEYMKTFSADELFEDEIQDIRTEWKETYTAPEYWYLITAIKTENETYAIYANLIKIIQYNEVEKPAVDYGYDKVEMLDGLTEEVEKTVNMIREGKYEDFIHTLPNRYKSGIIPMTKFLEIYPETRNYFMNGLNDTEIHEFTEAYSKYIKNKEGVEIPQDSEFFYTDKGTLNVPMLSEMTVNKYLEISAFGYRNVFKDAAAAKTPIEMYKRWADNRNGGFLSIEDYDSPEQFNKWFALDTMAKWEIDNPSHLWEAIAGGSRTRLMLFPVYNEKTHGFYFDLSNCEYCCIEELVRFYLALLHENIPVCVRGMEKIAKYLNSELNIGVVPCYTEPYDYMYGGFPDEYAIRFVNLDKETEKIEPYVKWYPVTVAGLANA